MHVLRKWREGSRERRWMCRAAAKKRHQRCSIRLQCLNTGSKLATLSRLHSTRLGDAHNFVLRHRLERQHVLVAVSSQCISILSEVNAIEPSGSLLGHDDASAEERCRRGHIFSGGTAPAAPKSLLATAFASSSPPGWLERAVVGTPDLK